MAEKSAKGSKLTEKSTGATTQKLDNSSEEEPTCEAAHQVQSVNKEAAQTSSTDLNTEKFKCDNCNYENLSEKGLTQHVRMKHCPSLKLSCSRHEHVDLCCDVIVVSSKVSKGSKVKAPPKVYHANLNMFGTYDEERSYNNSSFYAFHLPLPGRPDRTKYLECFVL